jgi:hypothetical protein
LSLTSGWKEHDTSIILFGHLQKKTNTTMSKLWPVPFKTVKDIKDRVRKYPRLEEMKCKKGFWN